MGQLRSLLEQYAPPPTQTEGFNEERFVVISGCSGGGKSTLLRELARRGHPVVDEPGRRIVKEELEGKGSALPWVNGVAFARRAVELALADRAAANRPPISKTRLAQRPKFGQRPEPVAIEPRSGRFWRDCDRFGRGCRRARQPIP